MCYIKNAYSKGQQLQLRDAGYRSTLMKEYLIDVLPWRNRDSSKPGSVHNGVKSTSSTVGSGDVSLDLPQELDVSFDE